MFTGEEMVALLDRMAVSHVVWLPDSTLGQWEPAMRAAPNLRLVNVCREGEAWPIAAGLHLGGARPTGLFEAGDALRNTVHDYRVPLFAIVGYRSYLNQTTLPGDTCLKFTEPILDAWKLDYRLIDSPDQADAVVEHYHRCRRETKPGVALLAEGKA